MLKISESYMIGVDIDEDTHESAVIILKVDSAKLKTVHTFTGEEAERFYNEVLLADNPVWGTGKSGDITEEKPILEKQMTLRDIQFTSRDKAVVVLSAMKTQISAMGCCTVQDYYLICGDRHIGEDFDMHFGWTNLYEARVGVKNVGCSTDKTLYYLVLPPARKLV